MREVRLTGGTIFADISKEQVAVEELRAALRSVCPVMQISYAEVAYDNKTQEHRAIDLKLKEDKTWKESESIAVKLLYQNLVDREAELVKKLSTSYTLMEYHATFK